MREFLLKHCSAIVWSTLILTLACTAPFPLMPKLGSSGQSGTAVLASLPGDEDQQTRNPWQMVANDSSSIFFSTGDTLHFPATDLHYMGKVVAQLGREWYIFSGRDSSRRNMRSLFVQSPGYFSSAGIMHGWEMPGRLLDHGGQEVYYEAEVFTGEVFPDTMGVVWYDRSLMPDGQWRMNTRLLQFGRPEPDTLVFFGHRRKSITQSLAFQGKCRLLKGEDQVMKP